MGNKKIGGSGIEIKNLYKIFGPNGADCVKLIEQGVTKTELNAKHGHVLGLKDINISMPAGGIQVIMGLSGSGKSTLIRHINRLIDPTSGEVVIGDEDVVKMDAMQLREFRRHQTAMVFQKFALLPHRTVLENTLYGLEIQGAPRNRQVDCAMRWIERVGLKGFEGKYPNQLSGGMQQRVGLARALANDAPILLMDEAFSALDPLIRVDMQTVLLDLQKEIKKTIVFITHDLDEALRLGDRIAILRDGEVVQQGTGQDIVMNPADDYIASFVREVNRARVIKVETVATAPNGSSGELKISVQAGATLEEAVRAMTLAGTSEIAVVDVDGQAIGALTLPQAVHAMVNAQVACGTTDAKKVA
ncbi:glycine betaine/proline transport system ATP-binding protein [Rhizobium sp. BK049]|uniref:quaternary amine ABC transporter ATP-binding protein n=1 Tax=Rhizobium TaxID=379 RepID=UPI00161EE1A7|nr:MULTISPECIES: glycine betaine/L-proline ABC transporter ATP-binding protein [Rhizobium]MBB3355215.1 glycine betaine/proline transport system ATP-binding protein [Rhizobium sp. BK049]MBX5153972.1 glycine betaine/L-proline ABC transporter ATP-binding protein [Rhizobium lentis]